MYVLFSPPLSFPLSLFPLPPRSSFHSFATEKDVVDGPRLGGDDSSQGRGSSKIKKGRGERGVSFQVSHCAMPSTTRTPDEVLIFNLLYRDAAHPVVYDVKGEEWRCFCCSSCKQTLYARPPSVVRVKQNHLLDCPLSQSAKMKLEGLSQKGILQSTVAAAAASMPLHDQQQVPACLTPAPPTTQTMNPYSVLCSFYRIFKTSTFFDDLRQLNSANPQCLSDIDNVCAFLSAWRANDPEMLAPFPLSKTSPLADFRTDQGESLPSVAVDEFEMARMAKESLAALQRLNTQM